MKMKLRQNDQIIVLNENEQAEVYEFYRLHQTMDRLNDVLEEKNISKTFKSNDELSIVARRVLELKDDYHVSEDEAIDTIFDDEEYINMYLVED